MNVSLSQKCIDLTLYVPGEQSSKAIIKLNTNENPYPTSPAVSNVLRDFDYTKLRLYPHPENMLLAQTIAEKHKMEVENVFVGGGSDEILGYAFYAFAKNKVYFPDITYGFYEVFARLCRVNAIKVPLIEDFSVDLNNYFNTDDTIVLANPNAPTGIAISPEKIESLLQNRERILVLDEAYIDFAPEYNSSFLLKKYDNLLIVRTLSKSYSLAGMRIGYALGHKDLIAALSRVKYAFNPYNLDSVSLAVGKAALQDSEHFSRCVRKIIDTRTFLTLELQNLGFSVINSDANFVFATHKSFKAENLFAELHESGILVRRFGDNLRICDYLRITVGTENDTKQLISTLKTIVGVAT